MALTVEQLFDSIAVRLNGPKAWSEDLTVDWHFTDLDKWFRCALSNGALIHNEQAGPSGNGHPADATLTLTKPQLLMLLAGKGLDGVQVEGDATVLAKLVGLVDAPDPQFPIVTP
jgi:alkyl sulfatase BDS1-like metallo-beta-lactamase superfamily hydrolase